MNTIESARGITLRFLKKHKYLDGSHKRGNITWTDTWDNKNSIGIQVDTHRDSPYLRLIYTNTSYCANEKTDIDYKVSLVNNPCNYGGHKWYFICPLSRNGKGCYKKVRTIYQTGKYFGCRVCAGLIYDSQTISENYRNHPWKLFDLEKQEQSIRVKYFKGVPTKRYKTFLKKADVFYSDYGKMNDLINRSKL